MSVCFRRDEGPDVIRTLYSDLNDKRATFLIKWLEEICKARADGLETVLEGGDDV